MRISQLEFVSDILLAAVKLTQYGTHRAQYKGIEPTGKYVSKETYHKAQLATVATSLTLFGKVLVKLRLAQQRVFVPCHSALPDRSIPIADGFGRESPGILELATAGRAHGGCRQAKYT